MAEQPTQPSDVTGHGGQLPASGAGDSRRSADIVNVGGGVMTDEVGVVTGELTLCTELAEGRVRLRVQYRDADEWYAVTGVDVPLPDAACLDSVHAMAVALLHRPEG